MATMAMLSLTIVILAILMPSSLGEVYSSVEDMKSVFNLERNIVMELLNLAEKMKSKLNKIQRYIRDFEGTLSDDGSDESEQQYVDRLVGNPFHAFNLMRRFTVDIPSLEKDLRQDDWKESSGVIQKLRLGSAVPKETDLHGAAQALIRLQDVYELDIAEVAGGKIGQTESGARLSAKDCLFIGKHCFNSGVLSRSIEWFEEAWMLAGEEKNVSVSQTQVRQFLDHAAKEHDERLRSGDRLGDLFPRPVFEEPPQEQRSRMVRGRLNRVATNRSELGLLSPNDDGWNFAALCRGEELRPRLPHLLRCREDMRPQLPAWLRLGPPKIETQHREPDILVYHDIITKRELEDLKKIATPTLARSQVMGSRAGSSEVSTTRTSKTGWLKDSDHAVIAKLTARIAGVTGLNTDPDKEDAELLQVANYMNGGHYNPHTDYVMREKVPDHMIYLPEKNLYIGDRIATWMFYLSDVAEGGRTVFPRIGAGVRPEAGAAVFWHNILPSGEADRLTLHGACPVLFGTKWVANKWLREGGQAFNRGCPRGAKQ